MTTQTDTGNILINVRARTQEASRNLRKVRSEVGQVKGAVRSMNVPLASATLGFGAMATAAVATGLAIHKNREEFWRLRNAMDRLGYAFGRDLAEIFAPIANALAVLLEKMVELDDWLREKTGGGLIKSLLRVGAVATPIGQAFLVLGQIFNPDSATRKALAWLLEWLGNLNARIESAIGVEAVIGRIKKLGAALRELIMGRPGRHDLDAEVGRPWLPGTKGLKQQIMELFEASWWNAPLAALERARQWIREKLGAVFGFLFGTPGYHDLDAESGRPWIPGTKSLPGRLLDLIKGLFAQGWWSNALDALDKAKGWITAKLEAIRDAAKSIWQEIQRYWNWATGGDSKMDEEGGLDVLERHRRNRRGAGGGFFDPEAAWRQQQQDRGYGMDFGGGMPRLVENPAAPVINNIQINALDPQTAADAVNEVLRQGTQSGVSAAPTLASNAARYQRVLRAPGGATFAATTSAPPIIRTPGRRGL